MGRRCWLLAAIASCAGTNGSEEAARGSVVVSSTSEPADSWLEGSANPAPSASSRAHGGADPNAFETRTHAGAGVSFDLAEQWQLSGAESSTLLATSADGRAVLMFHVAEADQLDRALVAIRRTLAQDVKDVYWGTARQKHLGELTAEYVSGAGKIAHRPVELGQLLVATPTAKILVVVAVIEAAASPVAKRQARRTLESIRGNSSQPHP